MQSWSTWLGALTVLGLGGFLASGCDEASASTTDGGTELDARTGTDAADEYNEFVSDDGTVKVKVGKANTPDGGLVISVFTDANIPDPFEEAIQASGGSLHGPIKAFEITPAGAIFDPPVEVSVLFDNPPPEDEPPVFVPLLLVDDSVGGLDQVRSPHHADASTEVRFVTPRAGSFAVAYGYAGVTVTHENQPGTRDVGIPFENTFTVSFDDTRVKKYGFHLSSDDCVEETGAAATQYSTTAVTPPATAPAMPQGLCISSCADHPMPFDVTLVGDFGPDGLANLEATMPGTGNPVTCDYLAAIEGVASFEESPSHLDSLIRVQTLEKNGAHYPRFQFNLGQHMEGCDDKPHWHALFSDMLAYEIQTLNVIPPASIEDMEPTTCGFGLEETFQESSIDVRYAEWSTWAKFRPPPGYTP